MVERDFKEITGAIISLLAGIAVFYSQNEIIKTLGTILIGAFVTYFVQIRLQKKSENDRLIKKNIEEIYIPLYLEINYNKENFLNYPDKINLSSWNDINNSYKKFILGNKMDKHISEYYAELNKTYNELGVVRVLVNDILYLEFKELLKSIKLRDDVYKEYERGYMFIIKEKKFQHDFSVTEYVIKNENPLQKARDKYIGKNVSFIFLYRKNNEGFYSEFDLIENEEYYEKYISVVQTQLNKEEILLRFRKNLENLLEQSKIIEVSLDKHIKKNYLIKNS